MAISLKKARDFVYSNGSLWERALYAYLFEGEPIERVHACLRCYQNPDGGYGHALEHDIRTPDSHPLALEYILGVFAGDAERLPAGDLFDGASAWCEANLAADGSLKNPPSVLEYPHAPWWKEGGQHMPDSIAGNLAKLGKLSPDFAASTRRWVTQNLTPDHIRQNEWLFMAYHAHDYYMNVDDFPDVEQFRAATVDNIRACAEKMPEKQYGSLLAFAQPGSRVAAAMPDLVTRSLDYLMDTQREDGGWSDQHDLAQWFPMTTIGALCHLQRHGRQKR